MHSHGKNRRKWELLHRNLKWRDRNVKNNKIPNHPWRAYGWARLSKVYRPTKHIIGHIGNDFTGHVTKPTVSKHWRKPVESHQHQLTMLHTIIHLGNRLWARRRGSNVTNRICWTCKNCSYKCATDCEHCVTQPSTEQLWQYSPLTSRQSPSLGCCLSDW